MLRKTLMMAASLVLFAGTLWTAEERPMPDVAKPHEPPQLAEMTKQITALLSRKGEDNLLVIEDKQEPVAARVEVVGSKADHFSIQIAFPSKEAPAKVFAAAGITVPATWKPGVFEPETSAAYEGIPKADVPAVAAFLQDVFIKLYKRPASYELKFTTY